MKNVIYKSLLMMFLVAIFTCVSIYNASSENISIKKTTTLVEQTVNSVSTDTDQADKGAGDIVKEVTVEIKEDKVKSPDKAITQELEKKAQSKKKEIKQVVDDIHKVEVEAEDIIEDKKVLEKEAAVKEHAAATAEQELKVLQKEAKILNSTEAFAKAKKLETEIERLKSEASLSREKVKISEYKAQLAQKKLEAHKAKAEDLREDYSQLQNGILKRKSILYKTLRSIIIILIGILSYIILGICIRKAKKLLTKKDAIREKESVLHLKTILALFKWLGSIIIFALIVFFLLESFGLNMAPLLAGAGIVGLAFGFGGQYLIRDIINGIFILLEGQYRINDVIKINDIGGLVEKVTLRITILRDLEGKVIYIPNGEIKSVINFTQKYSQALLTIGVAYKENVDRVMDVIKNIGAQMRQDSQYGRLILKDLEMLGVDDFADSQVSIKFRIKTLAMKQWTVAREMRRRIKNKFDELGIEIPFPHRTLYLGSGQDNEWIKDWALRTDNNKKKDIKE
ncbi:MAG: mechanosensitive ion channel [Candidatus Ancaeobacter aquaticus]|nr:mechanosensitive ion channel [Candidatus Ancaeobacter aquaticus]